MNFIRLEIAKKQTTPMSISAVIPSIDGVYWRSTLFVSEKVSFVGYGLTDSASLSAALECAKELMIADKPPS